MPKQKTKDHDKRAENHWRLWVVRNIPEAAKLSDFADLAGVAGAPALPAGTAIASHSLMPSLIQLFIESEKARVRPDNAEYREGTMQAKQFEAVRHALLQIGQWTKRHFGDRFLTVPFGDLWTMADYKAMMAYSTTQAEHTRHKGHSDGESRKNARRGYAPTYAKKFRTNFWRLVSFAEDYPYEQRLRFNKVKGE